MIFDPCACPCPCPCPPEGQGQGQGQGQGKDRDPSEIRGGPPGCGVTSRPAIDTFPSAPLARGLRRRTAKFQMKAPRSLLRLTQSTAVALCVAASPVLARPGLN